jgi:hypothetical protein
VTANPSTTWICCIAIVLAQRALPDDFDFNSTRRQFALGLDGAGVNALPKLM